MYPRVDWYKPVDTVILSFMTEHKFRITITPMVVSVNLGISSRHANRRLKILEDAGMVEVPNPPDKDGYYRATSLGERAAMAAIDSEELEGIDVDL
jgi:DNA-binding transcriptional ArsR family regulator